MWFTVQVTGFDATYGKRGCGLRCPIQRAVSRAVPLLPGYTFQTTAWWIDINLPTQTGIGLIQAVHWQSWHGRRRSRWIRDFDAGREVKPFAFRLNVPRKFVDLAALPKPSS